MAFSFGPKGGIQDPKILKLLAKLTAIVKEYGNDSEECLAFIEEHADTTTVDEHTKHMHSFREIAEPLAMLIGGVQAAPDEIPGDNWQDGNVEDMFEQKDDQDPADWWK